MRLRLALALMSMLAVIAVSGASAADFEGDNGACRETPGEAALLRCPTGSRSSTAHFPRDSP